MASLPPSPPLRLEGELQRLPAGIGIGVSATTPISTCSTSRTRRAS